LNSGGKLLGFGTINAPVQLHAPTAISVTPGGTKLTMKGAISGTGGIIAFGPGTLLLSSSNSYTGGTTVHGGSVQLGNASALGAPSGALAVDAGKSI
jgi:autotransporter-associated beta strand protein